ncbi:penicillin-binding transpeptidase domain-containing protein [Clostridium sp. KNHs216]|uniref:penicillin-binding transpeptidase domain-containing protein n=1 Tax=Clostridium sp. KNHs216 TaxID=1550235 RepID=UPI001150EEDB|nr:penicillin-binding transpeptidase domain-containing protein [Clostridium sp. KNHs216]TQI67663.1 penicillin-binding protein 2 [Clostridium sp. KNHs216]
MDKLKGHSRYWAMGLIIFAIMAVYTLRLVDWQILNGSSFLEEASKTSTSTVVMDAARGEILDSNGVGLAVNKTGYAIVFDRVYMKSETQNNTIHQLIQLLNQRGEKWTDILPIKLNAKGQYEFVSGMDKEIATLKSADYANVNSYATADLCMAHLIEKYKVTGYSAEEARNIVSVRYNMTKSAFGISAPYTFAEDVSRDTIAIISENSSLLPGATGKVTTVRQYPNGSLLPHVLGTIGSISREEYDELKDKGYAFNDRLGKSGIEQAFESMLRGKAGEKVVETTNTGALASETVKTAPVSGDTVYLTVDSRIQSVLNVSLANNVKATQANGRKLSAQRYKGMSSGHGEDCVAGAAVVLRVKDFSVLAASTYPTYDLTEYLNDTNYYTSLINNKDKPLIDRAFNGVFTPGSIIKPYVALAALQEKAITTSTRLEGNSKYTRFADTGLVLGSIGNYGMITANYAIQKSSNSFFYEVGYRLGITNMNLYAKRFGLGVKTGIELHESAGILGGPSERTAAGGGGWYDADTVEAAVGQADNKFTPLQLATYTATIANNGVRLKPHLVGKVTDYSRKNVISQTSPETVDNIGVSQSYIDYVKEAMRSVATAGTASSTFKNYGIAIAAKTGTAVQTPHSDNVTFVAFAPYDNPEIAVAVVLEHGATSMYSNAVAKDILDAYFYGKTVDANGNLVMPSASGTASSGASSGTASGTASGNPSSSSSGSSAG